jgi:hypothetical protein
MLKRTLVPLVFALFVILGALEVSAQGAQSASGGSNDAAKAATDLDIQMVRQDIRDHRKQVMAANIVLTPDEATKFWPLYDQYIQDTIKINDTRWDLIKDYATNYDKMSDDLAADYMKRSAAVDQQLIALREKYVPMFGKVVSAKKTAMWYQIDRRLDLVIDLQLAAMVPVVDASK